MPVLTKETRRLKRRRRVRAKVSGTATRPRISVFRSNRGISAQLIDDVAAPTARASRAGALLAQRANAAGVSSAVFDRGGYLYHGQVKALAEGAREAGLTI